MSTNDPRDERWIAYLLGECEPDEREKIEAEMRAIPDEAARVRALVEGVSDWVGEPTPYSPVDLEELERRLDVGTLTGSSKRWRLWAPLAVAAALVVVALTQVQFTVEWGDTALHWGQETPDVETAMNTAQLDTLAQRIGELEQAALETNRYIEALAIQDLVLDDQLRNATTRLAHGQRMTAQSVQDAFVLAGYQDSWPPALPPSEQDNSKSRY